MPSSITRRRVFAERAVATMLPTSFCARAARAIEEPIKPTPISAKRLNRGAVMRGSDVAALRVRSLPVFGDGRVGSFSRHRLAEAVPILLSPVKNGDGTKKAIKQQLGHGATGFLMKSAKVATASRFASSLPTLMRSALGNP